MGKNRRLDLVQSTEPWEQIKLIPNRQVIPEAETVEEYEWER